MSAMKTLVTAIQKGGQGKTFATCHLAFDFAERGQKVVVIDLDTQGNASFTLSNHACQYSASMLFTDDNGALEKQLKKSALEGITLIGADANLADLEKKGLSQAATFLQEKIAVLSDFYDVCLIDTPPSLGLAMTSALVVADYMLSPIELEAYSLQGMEKMMTVIGNLRKANPALQFIGMFPNKVDARKPRHIANLQTLTKAYPTLILEQTIGARDSIAQALGEKIPVWKIKKTAARKAAMEVRALAQYVNTRMELSQ